MSNEADVEICEYNTLRQEMLDCNKNAHNILQWGYPLIITLFSLALASIAVVGLDLVRILFFLLFLPIFIICIFLLWFGEIVRQQRAEEYLNKLEMKINTILNKKPPEQGLYWHQSLRESKNHPLHKLQYSHYKNISLTFLSLVIWSELVSIWMSYDFKQNVNDILLFVIAPIRPSVQSAKHLLQM